MRTPQALVNCVLCLLVVIAPARAELELTAQLPRAELVLGEPVFIALDLANHGQEDETFWRLWLWCDGTSRGLPCPNPVEVWADGQWRALKPGSFSRPTLPFIGWADHEYRPRVVLRPNERLRLWWDVGWHHDLPPGRYRTSVTLPKSPEEGGGPLATSNPVEFVVRTPTGKDLEAWNAGLACIGRWSERTHSVPPRYLWLPCLRGDDVADTRYAPWRTYLTVDANLGAMVLPYAIVGSPVWEDVRGALRRIEAEPDFPMAERLRLLNSVVWPLHETFGTPEFAETLDTSLQQLLEADDYEWAYRLFCAISAIARRHDEQTHQTACTERCRAWRWPWLVPEDEAGDR